MKLLLLCILAVIAGVLLGGALGWLIVDAVDALRELWDVWPGLE